VILNFESLTLNRLTLNDEILTLNRQLKTES
jgi:hypothetical protein